MAVPVYRGGGSADHGASEPVATNTASGLPRGKHIPAPEEPSSGVIDGTGTAATAAAVVEARATAEDDKADGKKDHMVAQEGSRDGSEAGSSSGSSSGGGGGAGAGVVVHAADPAALLRPPTVGKGKLEHDKERRLGVASDLEAVIAVSLGGIFYFFVLSGVWGVMLGCLNMVLCFCSSFFCFFGNLVLLRCYIFEDLANALSYSTRPLIRKSIVRKRGAQVYQNRGLRGGFSLNPI